MSGSDEVVAAIVQARMSSTRLPGKVLKALAGAPLIRRVLERVARIRGVDKVVVALAEGPENDVVERALKDFDCMVVRGPESDVLVRTARASRAAKASTVIRITSDCPMIDPDVSGRVLDTYLQGRSSGLRYARTAFDTGYPLGFDTEVFAAELLDEAESTASDPYEREHVTPYIWRRPELFPSAIVSTEPNRRHWRLVVDTEDDYRLACAVYDALYPRDPHFGYSALIALFAARPELLSLNAHIEQRPYIGLAQELGG
jgi:spore coat polysaccharide biosynthesis protein SpsF